MDPKKRKVLVVDDDRTLNTILRRFFEANEFVVESAFDGMEALSKAGSFEPDAVILDVMMPRENGYRVSRAIKTMCRAATGRRPPVVILLTARRLDEDPEREAAMLAFSMADEMLYKPFDPKLVLAKVEEKLGSHPA